MLQRLFLKTREETFAILITVSVQRYCEASSYAQRLCMKTRTGTEGWVSEQRGKCYLFQQDWML